MNDSKRDWTVSDVISKRTSSLPQVSLSRVGSSSVLGLRKQNEDRLRIARINDNVLYFAVFDGHGGPHAADYCYTFMEKFIRFILYTRHCKSFPLQTPAQKKDVVFFLSPYMNNTGRGSSAASSGTARVLPACNSRLNKTKYSKSDCENVYKTVLINLLF